MTVSEAINKFKISREGTGFRVWHKPNPEETAWLKSHKAEIMAELRRRENAAEEAERKAKEAEVAAIKSGEQKIRVYSREDGYAVYGVAAKLMEEIGFGKAVAGWGTKIPSKAVEVLGEEFTYTEALAYVRPQIEATEKADIERQAEIAEAFAKAQQSNQPVELSRDTEPCDGSVEECSLDLVVTYAMPDGKIQTRRTHTY